MAPRRKDKADMRRDPGRGDGSHEERLCVVSREAKDPDELIRFVVGPDDKLVPDLRRRLPGRGVWVTGTAAAVKEAVRRRAFGRSLKAEVVTSPALVEEVEALLRRDAVQALALANKAGGCRHGLREGGGSSSEGKCRCSASCQGGGAGRAPEVGAGPAQRTGRGGGRHRDRRSLP
jgi:predicted RNA-binding protein YlxR (DUF448 family)